MALVVTSLKDQAGRSQWVASQRLYLTADRSKVVEAGDPEGRFLLVSAGKSIPRDRAEELGLLATEAEPRAENSEPEVNELEPEQKEQEKPEDKQREKPADKSRFKRKKK